MMTQEIKEKVSSLEKVLEDFILQTNRGIAESRASRERSEKSMEEFKAEMRASRERSEKSMEDFKAEMKASRDRADRRMEEFRAEMQASRDRSDKRMEEFRAEMRASQDHSDKRMEGERSELEGSQEQSEEIIKESKHCKNSDWGEVACYLNDMTRDFAQLMIPFIAEKYFQCPEEPLMAFKYCQRRHSTNKEECRSFDPMFLYDDKVILIELRMDVTQECIEDFVELLTRYFEFFPEHEDLELIPIIAALYVDEQIVDYATERGIYILAIKGDRMDLLNYRQVSEGKELSRELSRGRGC